MRSAKHIYISMLKSWVLPMWAFPHRHTTIWHKILPLALVTTSTLYIPTLDSNTKTSKSSISLRLSRVLWAWVRHIPIVAWLNHHFPRRLLAGFNMYRSKPYKTHTVHLGSSSLFLVVKSWVSAGFNQKFGWWNPRGFWPMSIFTGYCSIRSRFDHIFDVDSFSYEIPFPLKSHCLKMLGQSPRYPLVHDHVRWFKHIPKLSSQAPQVMVGKHVFFLEAPQPVDQLLVNNPPMTEKCHHFSRFSSFFSTASPPIFPAFSQPYPHYIIFLYPHLHPT